MTIGYRQGVSIAVLIFYVPALATAIFLCIRHGLRRTGAWRFMIIFTLARVLGSSLELATISQPDNHSLYIGYATLINIALSPLELVSFGLLNRVVTSINRNNPTLMTPRHMHLAELLITVGLILSIIGGVNAGDDYGETRNYAPGTLSKVGLALFIAAFVLLALTAATLTQSIRHAEQGERRVLLAVLLSLPFLLVRCIYSALAVFANKERFSLIDGDVTVLLCMALLQEMVVVVLYEGVGLTLKKAAQEHKPGEEGSLAGEGKETEPKEEEKKGWLSRLTTILNLTVF